MSKKDPSDTPQPPYPKQPSVFGLLKPYKGIVGVLLFFTLSANAITLVIPKLISHGIDTYTQTGALPPRVGVWFALSALGIFLFTAAQSIIQVLASERVARNMRTELAAKISRQSYRYTQEVSGGKLLTILTSDVDSIKNFVAIAVASLISAVFIIFGTSVLLLRIDWKLGLIVLSVVPLIIGTFSFVFKKVKVLFIKSREVIDWLNRVISESIIGAAIIRVLDAARPQHAKFEAANMAARDNGLSILALFSAMIPIISFIFNLAVVAILFMGGHFVIAGHMSLGDFAAFNSYLLIILFPIFTIGFISNMIAVASASYGRIRSVLDAPEQKTLGEQKPPVTGSVFVKNLSLSIGEKQILKSISFDIKPKTKTAIIGPTAAGKTQLLYALIGLIVPTSGEIFYGDTKLSDYDEEFLHEKVGFVFQDSIMFNLSIRENIAFNEQVTDESMRRAIETAELDEFVDRLPQGLDTIVSERGTSLSGGQKQRIMLARALALNPTILYLDDFTARVDAATEKSILKNVEANYPDTTLISVTQKISSVEHYDQIILLMEGEILGAGTHAQLLASSPEYAQLYQSQKSTTKFEAENQ
jgi:ATP-binding cassette subfamily B protein